MQLSAVSGDASVKLCYNEETQRVLNLIMPFVTNEFKIMNWDFLFVLVHL
jgi:hypothetical protein